MGVIGVIPAAGKGTRLAPLPFSKELFPLGYQRVSVNGQLQWRPKVVSQYLIDNMIDAGVQRLTIILGTGKEAIMEYYGNGSRLGIDIAYLFQEDLHGMPFALNLARTWSGDDTVLFGMPDTVIRPPDAFRQLLAAHSSWQADLTLGVFRTDTPHKFGMVELNKAGRVIANVDKPKETHLKYMWGGACWSPSFGDLMAAFLKANPYSGREVVLSQVFQHAIDKGLNVRALRFARGEYLDIGTVDELQSAIQRYSTLSLSASTMVRSP